jgi:two-component system response regulator GlrR
MFARARNAGTGRASVERPNDDRVNGSPTKSRILVVEDQEDVRRMLVTALEIEGHIADEAASAPEGLQCLQQKRYNLVLSDYAMPGGTGTWMLHEASRQGLLDGTVALIVTAHPDVRDLADVEVITKPLDLDHFLAQVKRILAASRAHDAGAAASRTGLSGNGRVARVELVLYISSASPASLQALRTLQRLLEHFDASQVAFSVCDLARDPMAGAADRIASTPTLVRRYPEPKMWVLGNLQEQEIVADLLRVGGVDPKA